MNNRITNDLIQEIVDANDIVSVVSEYVNIKKAGKNYKGLCPFHSENTPSFIISEDKQLYHCFGCGAAGDVIKFVMNIENLDFIDAVELLAEKSGIDISKYSDSSDKNLINQNKDIFNINREAAIFFYTNLWKRKKNVMKYLLNRGLNKEVIKRFGLGYAIDEWEELNKYLLKKGFSQELIYKSGLVIKRKDEKGYYDRFRNRIIFPIFNTTDKIVGFGGRVLDNSLPKYLNSPESQIFNKSNILYGLHLAKKELGQDKKLILVEGYTDVMSLYQYGFKNVVASLGTALTKQHGELLKRYCNEVFITYDSDSAGEAATLRGLDILGDVGCNVKVVRLDNGKDPDEYIQSFGVNKFNEKLNNALPLIDYKIELLKTKNDINSNEGKINFIKNTIDILRTIKSPVELDIYVSKVSKDVGISANVIKEEIYGDNRDKKQYDVIRPYKNNKQKYEGHISPVKSKDKLGSYEIQKNIISLCLENKSFYNKIIKLISSEDFLNAKLKEIFSFIDIAYQNRDNIDKELIIDNFDIETSEIIRGILGKVIPYEDVDKTINELVTILKKYKIENEITLIKDDIKVLESKEIKDERDVKKINELCGELIRLKKQLIEVT